MQKIAQIITKIIDFFYHPFQKWVPKQLFTYGMCGGGNMVLDWILYFIIYNFVIGHELITLNSPLSTITMTPHIASLCIVFPITLLTGFWLNKHITFTQSDIKTRKQFIRYCLVVAINLAINYFGLKLCVDVLAWYPTPSKMVITVITVIISFFCQKYFSFAHAGSTK
ncbi:MAG: GtrA family protein [Paludibacteraceae bacterium]|nr:GtrA family protein [Paludibacteraceae bacterium]